MQVTLQAPAPWRRQDKGWQKDTPGAVAQVPVHRPPYQGLQCRPCWNVVVLQFLLSSAPVPVPVLLPSGVTLNRLLHLSGS